MFAKPSMFIIKFLLLKTGFKHALKLKIANFELLAYPVNNVKWNVKVLIKIYGQQTTCQAPLYFGGRVGLG